MSLFESVEMPPPPGAGEYFFPISGGGQGTNSGLGIGTLRLAPFLNPYRMAIDRIGAEVTSAGAATTTVRLGVYLDDGNCRPGRLILDAGTIAGDDASVQLLTVAATLPAGVLWVGGAVQGSGAQPTIRVNAGWYPLFPMAGGTSALGTTPQTIGASQGSVTGALPDPFTQIAPTSISVMPRVLMRRA